MDSFWQWLKRANARAVFLSSIAVLVAVGAWWGWTVSTPIQTVTPPVPPPSKPAPEPGLGLLGLLNGPRTEPGRDAPNPFLPPEPPPKPEPPRAKPEPKPEPPPARPEVKPTPPPKTEPPKPAPKPEVVRLAYRGMMQRSDGVRMALIEDSKTGRAAFYPVGATLFGLTVDRAEPEGLVLKQKDDAAANLQRGKAQSFAEGKRAD